MYLIVSHKAKNMKVSLLLLSFLSSLVQLNAQANQTLKEAESFFDEQKWEETVLALNPEIEKPINLSDKELIKAYFLRGQAYAQMTSDAYFLGKYPDAFFKAYQDLKKVIGLDQKNNYQAKAYAIIQNMRGAMTQNALRKVNEANIPNLNPAQAKEIAAIAIQFLNILVDMEPENYVFFDLRGQAQLAKRDSLPAAMDFQTAIRLYKDYPPEKSDFLIAYAYYRTAVIQRLSLAYEEQALQTIRAGLRFIKQEWAKTDPYDAVAKKRYLTALNDLETYELDILYNNPAYTDQAIEKFATAVEAQPNNYAIRCAYASLLEKDHSEEAIDQYQKAIALEPEKKLAYFNLSAIYINQSIATLKTQGTQDISAAEKQANQIAQKAVPYLERAHTIDPADRQIIKQLMTIFLRSNELEKYRFYKNKYDQLFNN